MAPFAKLQTTITDYFTTLLSLAKIKIYSTVNKNATHIDFKMALNYLLHENLHLPFCEDPNVLPDALTLNLNDSIKK